MIKYKSKKEMEEVFGDIELTFKGTEPFVVNDNGYPLGVLIARVSDGKVVCYLCGKWFEFLGAHLVVHKTTAKKYKKTFGFNRRAGLVSRKFSEMQSDNSRKKIEKRKADGTYTPPPRQTESTASNTFQRKNALGTCPAQYVARYLAVASEIGAEPTQTQMDKLDSGVAHFSKKFGKGAWKKFQAAVLRVAENNH